jgi:hypothetical protein
MARKIAKPLQETQERLERVSAIEAEISRVLSHVIAAPHNDLEGQFLSLRCPLASNITCTPSAPRGAHA